MPKKVNNAGEMQNYDKKNGQYLSNDFVNGFEKGISLKIKEKVKNQEMFDLLKKYQKMQDEAKNLSSDECREKYKKFEEENNPNGDLFIYADHISKNTDFDDKWASEIWNENGEHYFKTNFVNSKKDKSLEFKFGTKEELIEKANNQEWIDSQIDEHLKKAEEEENSRLAKVKENVERYKKATNEEKSKIINDFSNDEFEELFSDDNITEGTRVGGYKGYSKSNSAIASENQGSKPQSKWKKEDIMEYIENEPSLEPFYDELRKLNIKDLKDVALYSDGWHHTGAYYNKTDYYGITSPQNIVRALRDKRTSRL